MGSSTRTKEISNMSAIATMSTTTRLTKYVQMLIQHVNIPAKLPINLPTNTSSISVNNSTNTKWLQNSTNNKMVGIKKEIQRA